MSARQRTEQTGKLSKYTDEAVALIMRCARELGDSAGGMDGSDAGVLAALHVGVAPAFGTIAAAAGCERPNREQIRAVLDGFIALCERHSTPRQEDPAEWVQNAAEQYRDAAVAAVPGLVVKVSFDPNQVAATLAFRFANADVWAQSMVISARDFVDKDFAAVDERFRAILRQAKGVASDLTDWRSDSKG